MKKNKKLMRVLVLLLVFVGASSSAFGAYYMKHPWGGGSWEWKQLDGNNQVTAAYGGNGVNVHTSADDNGAQWIDSPTLVGNPTVGTQCVFKYDTNSKTVTITATSGGTGGGTTTTSSDIYIPGDFNSWNETGNPVLSNGTSTISLTKGTHKFKIIIGTQWYGNGGTMTRTNCTDWNFDANSGDAQINADVAGNYVFTVVKNSDGTPKVSVKYPSNADLAIKASVYSRNDYDTDQIVLTVTPQNITPSSYTWQVSTDKETWTDLGSSSTKTYTLSGNNLPSTTSFYRVKAMSGSNAVYSYTIAINVIESCGVDTEPISIFKMDFGTLSSEKERKNLGSDVKMATGYSYKGDSIKINDGNYAIVATPYYAGCGNDPSGNVSDACLSERVWYRQYLTDGQTKMRDRDYIKNPSSSTIGGMLMINFANSNREPVFVRELTSEETQKFSTGAQLRFSAWFASATQPHDDVPSDEATNIDMVLKIQYSDDNGTTWKDGVDKEGEPSSLASTVTLTEDWVLLSTDLYIVDKTYKYRIVITNGSSSGVGNDVLIDDVQLTVCKPTLGLQFDHPTDKENHILTSTSEEVYAMVPLANFGSITDPCIMLFEESKDDSGTTTYSYIDNMVLNTEGTYYKTENPIPVDRLFELNSEGKYEATSLVMRAVIAEKLAGTTESAICNSLVMDEVVGGNIKPEDNNPSVVFSDNTITASIACGSAVISDIDGDAKISECFVEKVKLPEIKFTLGSHISDDIRYTILLKDESGNELKKQQYKWDGKSNIDISEFYTWTVGAYTVQINVEEYNTAIDADKPLCVYQADGVVSIELKGHSDAPVLNRPGEQYAYNMCKTENTEEGKETDPNVIDNKYFFKDYLILEGEDKSGLVWLDMNGNEIPEGEAFFYADEVQDKAVKVYRNLEGSCPSETITVYYRVKAYTPEPVFTKDYNECALGESAELIELESFVDVEKSFENFDEPGVTKAYKYVDFINQETKLKEITFDPKVPGTRKYTVKVSLDETSSASNNYCESEAEYTVKVKGNATADNISANDATVCPGDELILIAEPNFTEEQKNVKLTWYADTTYERTLAYGETFKYHLIDNAYKVNPDTVYVTVQSDDYCENVPLEAKPVTITLKEQAPSLKLEPKDQTISVGGVPSFTVSPAGEQRYSLYVNDKKVDKSLEEHKPYIDSEYKLVYEGECGSSYDSARVEVQWPTVFTPYVKDGRNDTFVKDMDPNFYTKIFTRFGTKIYESDNGWDGSVGGSMNGSKDVAAPGVYYYVVELPDGNVKKGTIEVFKY